MVVEPWELQTLVSITMPVPPIKSRRGKVLISPFPSPMILQTASHTPTWIERTRAGIPNMIDVMLRKPQIARTRADKMM